MLVSFLFACAPSKVPVNRLGPRLRCLLRVDCDVGAATATAAVRLVSLLSVFILILAAAAAVVAFFFLFIHNLELPSPA